MDRVLWALAAHRASRAPLIGLLLDPRRKTLDASRIELHGSSVWGPLGMTELATLADLALGAAIRHRIGSGGVLPTVTLTLGLDRPCEESEAMVRAAASAESAVTTGAVAELSTSAGPLGRALATFAMPRGRTASPLLPWEKPHGEPLRVAALAPADLNDAERGVVAAVDRAAETGLDPAIGVRWARDGIALEGELTPGLALLNRSRNVQGGAIVGLAATATRALFPEQRRLLDAHVQFLAAASSERLRIRAEPIKAGRTVMFSTVTLSQRDTPVAYAAVTVSREDR